MREEANNETKTADWGKFTRELSLVNERAWQEKKKKAKVQFSHDHFIDDDIVASSSSSFAFNSAPIVSLCFFYVT